MEETLIRNEEAVGAQIRRNRSSLCIKTHFILKIIELVMSVTVTALLSQVGFIADTVFKVEIVHGTVIGFIMMNVLIVFAELTQPMGKAPLVLSSVLGCLMFTLSGVFLLQHKHKVTLMIAGIICILEGILFFCDFFAALCYRRNYEIID